MAPIHYNTDAPLRIPVAQSASDRASEATDGCFAGRDTSGARAMSTFS
jgi:hypothetical protein